MLGLMYKDLMISKKQSKFLGVVFLVYFVLCVFAWHDIQPLVIMGVFFVSTIVLSTFTWDERCNWDRYARVLPVSRRMIVTEKYLLNIIIAGVLCALVFLVSYIANGTMEMMKLSQVITLCTAALIIPDLSFPLVIKFGSEKGRNYLMGVYVLIGIIVGVVVYLVTASAQAEKIITFVTDNASWLAFVPAVIIAIFSIISYCISCALYEKKDL